jgi:peptidoglycan hydrolase-like protein with peptidoglycan-binding domain
MSLQNLQDAGVHPMLMTKARSNSFDPAAIIAVINQFLAVLTTGGGGSIITAILNLLGLFTIKPGPSTTTPVSREQQRDQLLRAGVDQKLLEKAEAGAVDPTTIVAWIETIMNVLTVAGPACLQAIIALLNAFNPPAPAPVVPPGAGH